MAETGSIAERAKTAEADAAAIAEAERKGRTRGGRLRAAETAMRNGLIVQRVHQQWTWPMIAEEAGVSARQCQRVYENYREGPSPFDVDPSQYVEELAIGYRISIGEFIALAASADNTAAAVGALKGANDAREKMLALMQAVGVVPEDLGVLKLHRDVQQVAQKMLDGIERFEAGLISSAELAAIFYEMAGIERRGELPVGDVAD